MITELRIMFENQARVERYSKSSICVQLTEGSPVSPHVIKMIGYIENLEKLGFLVTPKLATYVFLQSLPASFEPFIMNFHMVGMVKNMIELHGMLKTAEESIKKNNNHVMMVQKDARKWMHKGKGGDKI